MTSLDLIPIACSAGAAWIDARTREIPDRIPLFLLVTALGLTAFGGMPLSITDSALGVLLGLGLTLPLALVDGVAGGDVKLVAALGAWLGPGGLLKAAFWMAIGGAALSIVAAARGKRDFAYGPAIFLGVLVQLAWPDWLTLLMAPTWA